MPSESKRIPASLTVMIRSSGQEILQEWLSEQLSADTLRLDLIDEKTLEVESQEFLAVLSSALGSEELVDFERPAWQPVLSFLDELSRARDHAGFGPIETASFVLSLKQPLFARSLENPEKQSSKEEIWCVNQVLDHLALYTTDLFRERREATILRQQEEMEELSTPVVKVWDGILALPLVGTLDTRRSQMVTESLLEAIAATGSEIAILDMTGVPAIDTRMAQHLMRTVAATRLMGADCILSGIRPQIAQTIVHLKIQLGDIKTESTLAAALKSAFRQSGLKVQAEG